MRRVLLLSGAALLTALVAWWAPWGSGPEVGPGDDAGARTAKDAGAGAVAAAPVLRGEPRAAPAHPASEAAALFGRVLDALSRKAIAGATLRAFGYEDLRRVETTTGEDGAFRFPETAGRAGAFHLVVTARGYGRFTDPSARAGAEPRTILLEPEGSIEGRVAEAADGSPVRRYRVLALRRAPQFTDGLSVHGAMPTEQVFDATVSVDDAQGRFHVGGLAAGIYGLLFLVEDRAPFFWGGGAPVYHRDQGLRVAAGTTTDAGTVALPRSDRVVVRVLDAATDRPLSGASFEGNLAADEGEVRVPLRPLEVRGAADYVLLLPFDGAGRMLDVDVGVHVSGYAPDRVTAYGQAPGEVFTVRLSAPAAVKGTVGLEGQDGAGLLLLVRRGVDRAVVATAVAGPGGAFSLAGLPADIELELLVFERAADRLRLVVPLRLRAGETRELALGGAGATGVEGRVTIHGAPVAQAWVFLDAGEQRIHCPTDDAGRFRFEAVPAGRWPLFANLEDMRKTGEPAYLSCTVAVEEGRMARVAIDLSTEVRGRLAVRRTDGSAGEAGTKQIVARAAAASGERADWSPETRTAADGSFTLWLPGAGAWIVDLDEEDLALVGGAVTVDVTGARDAAPPLDLLATEDPKDGRVEIEVRDAETGDVVPDPSYRFSHRHTAGVGSGEGSAPIVLENATLGTYRFVIDSDVHVPTAVEVEVTLRQRQVKTTVSLPRSDAVRVTEVDPDGPAGATGLRAGDLVLRYGDARTRNVGELRDAAKAETPGDRVRLEIARDGASRTVTVPGGRLGIRIENARTTP